VFVDIGANVVSTRSSPPSVSAQRPRVLLRARSDDVPITRAKRAAQRFRLGVLRERALSDREGEMPFFTVSDGSAHSLVPETPSRAERYSGQVRVRVTRLDDLVREGTVDPSRIDLIKIDVEGEEPRTVAGLRATLERFGYPRVWAEVRGPRARRRAPNTYPAVARTLRDLGYMPLQWKKGVLRPVQDEAIQGREDVLFRHP